MREQWRRVIYPAYSFLCEFMSKNSFRVGNTEHVLVGSWITLAHPAIAEIMAKAGFDWLAVDMEHSVITIREAEELIRVIDLAGVVPLVRLTSNEPDQIKRVMDAGAYGIIVPNPEQLRLRIEKGSGIVLI